MPRHVRACIYLRGPILVRAKASRDRTVPRGVGGREIRGSSPSASRKAALGAQRPVSLAGVAKVPGIGSPAVRKRDPLDGSPVKETPLDQFDGPRRPGQNLAGPATTTNAGKSLVERAESVAEPHEPTRRKKPVETRSRYSSGNAARAYGSALPLRRQSRWINVRSSTRLSPGFGNKVAPPQAARFAVLLESAKPATFNQVARAAPKNVSGPCPYCRVIIAWAVQTSLAPACSPKRVDVADAAPGRTPG